VVLQLGGLGEVLTTPPRENPLLRNVHKAKFFLWRQNGSSGSGRGWRLDGVGSG